MGPAALSWNFLCRAISWLHAHGRRFTTPPKASAVGRLLHVSEPLPPHLRAMFKNCVPDEAKRSFIRFFDALPPDQKPPLVTYIGRPMKISAKGVPKLDKEAVKKAKADDIAANGHKKKVKTKRAVPAGPDFYNSREWKELRYKVLTKHGARCMCCGATPQDGSVMHVDHIKPRSRFPDLELEFSNCQVLCSACNLGKSNKDRTDWRGAWREKATPLDDEYRRVMGDGPF